MTLTRERIQKTAELLRPYIRRTPVIDVCADDFGLGSIPLSLKLELLQHTGSFKPRGAFTNLLTREIPAAGVVAASGGNHGVAVAYAAMKLKIPARIFVPTVAPSSKTDLIRAFGADLVITGDRYPDALAASEQWLAASGALPIHAYDQWETLAGQGTLGLEFEEQSPGLDTLLVAIGGGGLIGGVAGWYEGRVKIVGVEPETAPTLTRALEAGKPVDAEAGGIAADSLAPKRVGELMFPIARAHVARVVLVSDAAIARAQQTLWDRMRIVAEPGAAAACAALLQGAYKPAADERVGAVISGANTTAVEFR